MSLNASTLPTQRAKKNPSHLLTFVCSAKSDRKHLCTLAIAGTLLLLMSLSCALMPSPPLVIAGFAVLAIGIGMILQPRFALLLLVISAGLPSITLPLPDHNMHLVEPVIIIMLLVSIARRKAVHFSAPHLLALLFLILAIISFAHIPQFSSDTSPYGADKRLIVLFITITPLFLGTCLAAKVEDGDALLSAMLMVSIPLYGVALAQAIGLHLLTLLESPNAYNFHITQGRLWGPFAWSVNFGMYLVNLMAVANICWLQGTHRRSRVIGFGMTIATTFAIIGSGTRSAAFAAIVIFIIACLLCRRRKVLVFSVIIAGIISILFFNKLLLVFNHDVSSTDNRLLLWEEAIKLITSNPWLGIGLQQFHFYYAQLIVGKATELDPLGIHPHEQYLEWAVESGVLWSLLGTLLLLSIIITCWRASAIVSEQQRGIVLVALLAVLGNSIIGFVDTPFDQLEGATVLFLLAGLALGMIGNTSQKPPARFLWPRIGWSFPRQKLTTYCSPKNLRTPKDRVQQPSMSSISDDMQRSGRTVIIQLLSWGMPLPVIFSVTALLTRYLGPIQYGEYSLTLSFLTIFALFSGTGMDPLIIRQLSCQPRHIWSETLSYATGTRFASTSLSAILGIATAFLLPISTEQRSLFLLGCMTLFFSFSCNGLRTVYSHGYRAEQSIGLLALLETSNRLMTASLIALIIRLRFSILWTYIILAYSDLPMFLIQTLCAQRRYQISLRFSWRHFQEHLRASLPLLGHNALSLLAGQVDICVLMIVSGPSNAGIYALASRIIDPIISIAFAYVNGIYPFLCKSAGQNIKYFGTICYQFLRLLSLVMIPFAICISTQASVLVNLLGGQRFASASMAVQLLMWAMVCTFFNQLAERICTAINREHEILLVSTIAGIANILLNILLVPHWLIGGASLATLGSEALACSLFAWQLRVYIQLASAASMLCLVLLSNLPLLILLAGQQSMSLLYALPLGLCMTMIGYHITGLCTPHDIRQVFSILRLRSISNE